MRTAQWAIAGAVTLAATVANAADYTPPQQPICVPRSQAQMWPGVPLCAEEYSAWYLRGDIGITNQKVKRLENALLPASTDHVNRDFDASGLFGVGVGYQFNNWLRADATGGAASGRWRWLPCRPRAVPRRRGATRPAGVPLPVGGSARG